MKIEFSPDELKENYDRKLIRKFMDMKNSYKNPKGINGNPLIYSVYIKSFGNFETGYNVLNPGKINGEFFMTKGHKHNKELSEIYILYEGKGKLLVQDKKARMIELRKGKTYIIPANAGHRLINSGNKPLGVLTIYPKNAGQDYNFNFKKHLIKK